jgi:membrane-associated phospholipid phosphatase
MFTFEWVTIVYVAGLLGAALVTGALRTLPAVAGGAILAGTTAVAALGSSDLRFWMGPVYLLAGYWLPGLMVRPDELASRAARFEAWLARTDGLFVPWLPRVPEALRPIAEMAYLSCSPLVPATFALIWWNGTTADFDRFWVSLLVSGFASYATLPWLFSRPPRSLARPSLEPRGVQRLNIAVLGRFSHGWNTVPSGHVAVSCAAALSLWSIWPAAGIAVGLVAIAISIGAVSGGYHYVIDIAAGWLLAVVVAVIGW